MVYGGNTSMQKTVECFSNQITADDFAEQFIEKINQRLNLERKKEDWVFKAAGTAEVSFLI
jgi:hypothetical protein